MNRQAKRRAAHVNADVTCGQISNLTRCAASAHAFVRPDLTAADVAVKGLFRLTRLKSGIVLHATDLLDLHDMTTEFVSGADLTFSIVLDGELDFTVNGREFAVKSDVKNKRLPKCSALMLTDSAQWCRRATKGARTRKVSVAIDGERLDSLKRGLGGRRLSEFTKTNMAHQSWQASPRMLALAEQLLTPPSLSPSLLEMYIEGHCLELATEALATLGGEDTHLQRSSPSKREALHARQARDYIDANVATLATLGDISREIGVSPTILQRRFKATYGTTVVEYLRARKLELARLALEREGVSIAEAAFLAGYTNPANFATAFRRTFGISPSSARL